MSEHRHHKTELNCLEKIGRRIIESYKKENLAGVTHNFKMNICGMHMIQQQQYKLLNCIYLNPMCITSSMNESFDCYCQRTELLWSIHIDMRTLITKITFD